MDHETSEVHISPGTSTRPKPEMGVTTAEFPNTPIKQIAKSTDSGQSGKITKSAIRNTSRRGSGTRKPRTSANDLDQGHQDKPQKKGEKTMAAHIDHSDRNIQAEMKSPVIKKTNEKVRKNLEEKGNGNMRQHALKKETSAHILGDHEPSTLHKTVKDLKKNEENTSRKTYEARIQNKEVERNREISVTTSVMENMKRTGSNFIKRNTESKEIYAGAEVLSDENLRKLEHKENEEQIRRRSRLSNNLGSSGTMLDSHKTETGMIQLAQNISTSKETGGHILTSDYNMSAGDGQEDHLKTISYQSQNHKTRNPETESGQLSLPTNRNLEAGGDAGIVPMMQHCGNKTLVFKQTVSEYSEKSLPFRESESAQVHQIIKTTDKITKGTSIQKGDLNYATDPQVIPIKPIPAILNYATEPQVIPIKPVPAIVTVGGQADTNTLGNLNNTPFIPTEASLLYQPDSGVMKSRPIPKPTRGRRCRRQSPASMPATGFTGFHPYGHQPEMHYPEQTLYAAAHPYQRYMPSESGLGLSDEYCEVVRPGHRAEFMAYPANDASREVMGSSGEDISSAYPGNTWYCKEDYLKIQRPFYAPAPSAQGRGSVVSRGRPRGRRSTGGVRQYLQHRLLWARYTGRSQEALDRVLSIINNRLQEASGLKGVVASSQPQHSKLWAVAGEDSEALLDSGVAGALAPVARNGGGIYGRVDNSRGYTMDRSQVVETAPYHGGEGQILGDPEDPYMLSPYYTPHGGAAATSYPATSISNRMIGDAAVVLTDQVPLHGSDIKMEIDVRKAEMMPSQPSYLAMNTPAIPGPSNLVSQCIPSDANVAGVTGQASGVTAAPQEGLVTSLVTGHYPAEKEGGKQMVVQKKATPKSTVVKTPVSPVKEYRVVKRQGHGSGGIQKKKVRRSLTFPSPIKQEETLRATENIANALSNSSPQKEAEAGCSGTPATDSFGLPSVATPLPSISKLIHSTNNAGISINIHVTNDANKEQTAPHPHPKSEDKGAGRRMMTPATLEETKSTAQADMLSRSEASSAANYPVPRYLVEWHGDYFNQKIGEVEGPRMYQEHNVMPTAAPSSSTNSGFRYPYRDPNSSLSCYPQQHMFSAPAPPMNRYYSLDYTREWTPSGGAFTRYPSQPTEHFMPAYESQQHHHPAGSTYQPNQWSAGGWSTAPTEMFMESYNKHLPTSTRSSLEMQEAGDLRDVPYTHFYRAAPATYPRAQVELAEEVYPQHQSGFAAYQAPVMVGTHANEKLVTAVPEEIQEVRQHGGAIESQYLHRPWQVSMNCNKGPQGVLEGSVGQLAPATDSPQQLQPSALPCAIQEQGHMEASDVPSQLPKEQAQQM